MRVEIPLEEDTVDEELANALYSLYNLHKQTGQRAESLQAFRECEQELKNLKVDGNTNP